MAAGRTALPRAELGQLLWAAQGEADARDGVRTAVLARTTRKYGEREGEVPLHLLPVGAPRYPVEDGS